MDAQYSLSPVKMPKMPDPDAPQEIGDYRVLAQLADGTYHAIGPGGRAVVLKQVDPTCLLGDQLHSQIRDRLNAIRGLAHPQVANLYTVEREGEFVFTVWEYIDAQRLDDWAVRDGREPRHVIAMARELVLAVQALHALGIVHGRIGAGNVFVNDGRIRLTDLSPLLYTDPREDAVAVVSLLLKVVEARQELDSPLGRLLQEAQHQQIPLAELGSALAGLSETGAPRRRVRTDAAELTPRGRSITAAILVALVGILIAWAIWQFTTATRPTPPMPPDLEQSAVAPTTVDAILVARASRTYTVA
jgi:tRNA A-37 threonylcarbamoyl transferase component Bud32